MTLTNTGGQAGSFSITTNDAHIKVNGSQSASGTVPGHGSVTVTFTSGGPYFYFITITMTMTGTPTYSFVAHAQ